MFNLVDKVVLLSIQLENEIVLLGLFKKIAKAIKKAANTVVNVAKKVVEVVKSAIEQFLDTLGNLVGKLFEAIFSPLKKMFEPAFNFLLENIFKLLRYIVERLMKELGPYIEAIASFMVTLWIRLFNWFLEVIGFNRILAKGALKFAGQMYEAIINNDAVEMLGYTPKTFQLRGKEPVGDQIGSLTNAYYMSLEVMKNVALPSAMVIFSLMVLVEFFQITTRTEGMRNSGFEAPFKLMLKVAACKLALDNASLILESITGFGQEMFRAAYSAMGNVGSKFSNALCSEANINDLAKNMVWYTLLMLYIQMFLQYMLIKAVMYIIPFLVFGRMVELYVMIALSPIPLSTFASPEFGDIGKSFLKQFVSVALKGAIMYIIILVFASLFTVMTFDFSSESGANDIKNWLKASNPSTLMKAVLEMVIKPLVFAFMMLVGVTSSDKYARQITGAMYW